MRRLGQTDTQPCVMPWDFVGPITPGCVRDTPPANVAAGVPSTYTPYAAPQTISQWFAANQTIILIAAGALVLIAVLKR